MWTQTLASLILQGFGEERRRIVSDWRILIAARRLAYAENAPLPDENKASDVTRYLINQGKLVSVKGAASVYLVDVPYANLIEITEEQIIQEANPWAVFSHLTAMVYHSLTDVLPGEIFAIHFKDGEHLRRVPLGTTPEDWTDLNLPLSRQPHKVQDIKVNWTESQSKWEFGVMVGYSSGQPIYVTDVERTLLDALRKPGSSGGIAKVFHAWRSAENLDVDRIVEYTDRFDIQILRQRVGFLLGKLGHSHARLEEWRHRLQRGGSVRLVAGEPHTESYSPEWNLSLNVPSSVLAIIE